MSKREGRRGFVDSQREAAAPSTKAWDEAQQRVTATFKAFEAAWTDENAADAEAAVWNEARDALLGTPAPNGAALAYKIGLYGYTDITDNFDVAAGVFQPDRIAKIIGGDDEAEKGLLALYFDALALAGVQATVPQPSPFGPLAQPASPSPGWRAFKAEYLASFATYSRRTLELEDREPGDPEYEAVSDAHRAYYDRLCAFPVTNAVELADKFDTIMLDCWDEDDALAATKADLERINAPPTPPTGTAAPADPATLTTPVQAAFSTYGKAWGLHTEGSPDHGIHAAVEATYDTPAQTAEDCVLKLTAYLVDMNGGGLGPNDPNLLDVTYEDLPPAGKSLPCASILAGIIRELRQKLASHPHIDTAAWDEARRAYEAADAAFVKAIAEANAADYRAEEESPPPPVLYMKPEPGLDEGAYYQAEDWIERDRKLSDAEKAEKIAAVREWLPERQAAEAKHRCDELSKAVYAAGDAVSAARDALIDAPAPHNAALLYKLRLYIEDAHEIEGAASDQARLGSMLSDEDDRIAWAARLYQDAARLASQPVALTTSAADRTAWDTVVAEYRALDAEGVRLFAAYVAAKEAGEPTSAINAQLEANSDASGEAINRLLDMRAPDAAGIAFKIKTVMDRITSEDIDDPKHQASLLRETWDGSRPITSVYLDAVALAGGTGHGNAVQTPSPSHALEPDAQLAVELLAEARGVQGHGGSPQVIDQLEWDNALVAAHDAEALYRSTLARESAEATQNPQSPAALALGKEADAAYQAFEDAWKALLTIPAPDRAGVAQQVRAFGLVMAGGETFDVAAADAEQAVERLTEVSEQLARVLLSLYRRLNPSPQEEA